MKLKIITALLVFLALVSVGYAQQTPNPLPPIPIPVDVEVLPTPPSEVVVDQPAVPTTEVPSPVAPVAATDRIMWALLASYLLNFIKKSAWFPLLSEQSDAYVKWAFGLFTAVCTAVGINVAISGNIFDAAGATFSLTGISWVAFKDIAWQWGAQQAWYTKFVKNT